MVAPPCGQITVFPMDKPETIAEREIRAAQARGEFDDLPGMGKPLPGLDDPPDEMWWLKEKLKREQLSILPDSLQLQLDVERALEERFFSEAGLRARLDELNQRIARVNSRAISGPPTTLAPAD